MDWKTIDIAPEKNGRYLVIDQFGIMGIEYWWNGEWTTIDPEDQINITHWMPIPAPPEGIPDRRYF